MLKITASKIEVLSPNVGSNKNPAPALPKNAPIVLKPYRYATLLPISSSRPTNPLASIGNVAPIQVVGITRITTLTSNLATVNTPNDSPTSFTSTRYMGMAKSNRSGTNRQKIPIEISNMPYILKGLLMEGLKRPARKLPSARPPMKQLRTVVTANVVPPKTKTSRRLQTIS